MGASQGHTNHTQNHGKLSQMLMNKTLKMEVSIGIEQKSQFENFIEVYGGTTKVVYHCLLL